MFLFGCQAQSEFLRDLKVTRFAAIACTAAAETNSAGIAAVEGLGSQVFTEIGQSITLFQKLLKRRWPVSLRTQSIQAVFSFYTDNILKIYTIAQFSN